MRRAVFLDKDGTIIDDVPYNVDPAWLRLAPNAGPALRLMQELDYRLIVVSNQSGVARGLFSEAQMHAFNDLIVRKLAAAGGRIGAVYACPFHAEGSVEAYIHPDHPDRKPNPGMLIRAAAEHHIDMAKSFMIGDQPSDMEAARRAGVPGFRFEGGDLDDFVKDLLGA